MKTVEFLIFRFFFNSPLKERLKCSLYDIKPDQRNRETGKSNDVHFSPTIFIHVQLKLTPEKKIRKMRNFLFLRRFFAIVFVSQVLDLSETQFLVAFFRLRPVYELKSCANHKILFIASIMLNVKNILTINHHSHLIRTRQNSKLLQFFNTFLLLFSLLIKQKCFLTSEKCFQDRDDILF